MPILLEGTQRNSAGSSAALLLLLLLSISFSATSVSADFTFGGGEGAEEAAEEEVEEQVEEQIEETVTDETTEVTEEEVADSVEEQVIEDAEEAVEDELTFGGLPSPAEDEVEEQVEEQLEEQFEEELAEEAEESVEEEVAEQTEGAVEEEVAEQTEEVIEDQVAEQSEASVEDEVEEATEQQVVDITEETVEDEVEAEIEESVVAAAEDSVAESVEDEVGTVVEDVVEEAVSDTTAAEVEEQIADSVEQSAEDSAEQQVVESVDQVVEEAAEEQVAEAVDQVVEETAQEQVAEVVEQSTAEAVEEEIADATASAVEANVSDTSEGNLEELIAQQLEANAVVAAEALAMERTEGRLSAEVDEVLDAIEAEIDIDARRIHQDQWLVMAEPKVFDELADEGYIFDEFTELPGLGLRLAEVAAPASFDISTTRDGIMDVVGSDRAEVDLNHIYTAGTPELQTDEAGILPLDAMAFPEALATMNLRIGIVDSAVDTDHPAFASAKISSRPFAAAANLPNYHGTAIASIIAANAVPFRGLAPEAELFAAAVFEQDDDRGEIASTVSLVRALDWLLSSEVDAINLSLAGPPNRLLEVALTRISEQGVMVLAAAGNGGPMARPQYPAAYTSVVAVTAVDQRGRAFRLANRGDYLDLAAPGVNLRHAVAGGGYASSSGTSFAVPFAVTAAALMKHQEPDSDVIARLYAAATDIGPPGRDDIYGYGLLTL